MVNRSTINSVQIFGQVGITGTDELTKLFANISINYNDDITSNKYRNANEWQEYYSKNSQMGIKAFKRRVLGFCGTNTVKSLDELANIFVEMKATSNKNEALKLLPLLTGRNLDYRTDILNTPYYLNFERVSNNQGQEGYRIIANQYYLDSGW